MEGRASPVPTAQLSSSSHTENPFQKVRRKPRTKLLNRFDEASPPKGLKRKEVPGRPVQVNGMTVDESAPSVDNTSPKHAVEAAEVNGKQDKPVGQVCQPSVKPTKEQGWNRADKSSSPPPSQPGGAAWTWTPG